MASEPHHTLGLYLGTLAGTALLVAVLCFAVNALVDPLWYFRGNVLTGVNYAFNERTAKMVRLLPRLADYDCLFIGSSHTALLHERRIAGHRCFNLGVSHGRAGEFLALARYLRTRGARPSLIFVNVDLFDFQEPPSALTVPQFIRSGDDPPSVLRTYLTLDALGFSLRTLGGAYPNHLIYDARAEMHIIPKSHPYRPPRRIERRPDAPPFHPEIADVLVELRQSFPEARAVAWAPPISAWRIAQLKADGALEAYLDALQTVSRAYDGFLDFSIPSDVTASTTNTFDGDHYVDAVNNRTVDALAAGKADFGIDWHQHRPSDIAALYEARLGEFVDHREISAAPAR
jgi:hypothetical protein